MTQLEADLNYISSLPDQPAMTTAELKAEFDMAGNTIKDYINSLLLPEITSSIATCLASAKAYADAAIGQIELSGENITYDNTESDLEATNVQDAIDEVKGITDTLSTNVGKKLTYTDLKVVAASKQITALNGRATTGTLNISESGYYPIGIVGVQSSNATHYINISGYLLTSRASGSGTITFVLANDAAGDRTTTMTFEVLWAKIS